MKSRRSRAQMIAHSGARDVTPYLPIALVITTMFGGQGFKWPRNSGKEAKKEFVMFLRIRPILWSLGGLCVIMLQIPKLSQFTGTRQVHLLVAAFFLYIVTLTCMADCTFTVPGSGTSQLSPRTWKPECDSRNVRTNPGFTRAPSEGMTIGAASKCHWLSWVKAHVGGSAAIGKRAKTHLKSKIWNANRRKSNMIEKYLYVVSHAGIDSHWCILMYSCVFCDCLFSADGKSKIETDKHLYDFSLQTLM